MGRVLRISEGGLGSGFLTCWRLSYRRSAGVTEIKLSYLMRPDFILIEDLPPKAALSPTTATPTTRGAEMRRYLRSILKGSPKPAIAEGQTVGQHISGVLTSLFVIWWSIDISHGPFRQINPRLGLRLEVRADQEKAETRS